MTKYYKVGKIVNTHGVRGEVRVITSSDFSAERYAVGNKLYYFMDDTSVPVPLIVQSHRAHKNFDLLTFENHPNINDVEKYKGGFLKVHTDDRGSLEDQNGEYYYDDIIGCEVFTEEGEKLGKVKEILSPGANDVWVIQRIGKGKDILIPYIDEVVKEVLVSEKRITIHVLEGLME
ncbi:ribosome maturation factor RimM [Caldalkalibacillus mannanilyticus]|uniref:ribosome maturation factor RimM n=1 Tax=Caldalkalibacillus mannanilyticus TaxID=1418 RepID=UPI00046B028D|nr:ribosome maturation factor RimM [Caldalkalibacillus mannanilyticus]